MIECIGSELIMHNMFIKDIITTSQSVVFISGSMINQIRNLSMTDENAIAFHIMNTNITLLDNLNIINATSGIYLEQSQLTLFQNSMIKDCGSTNIINGGAIFIENSNSTINNVTFDQNIAKVGGALHIK